MLFLNLMRHYKRIFVIARDSDVEAKVRSVGTEKIIKGSTLEYHVFDPSVTSPKFECDLMIAAGGDGTLFYAVSGLVNPSTPVLHVGMGNKGFLAEVELSELPEKLAAISDGKYTIESVRKLSAKVSDGWNRKAMNEVVFASRSWKGVLSIRVDIGGLGQIELVASGVMVSTPLGSTAFCLASGGPALDDSLPGIILCPILPRRRWPPIVVHSDRTLSIQKTGGKDKPILVLDGLAEHPLEEDAVVTVTKSDEAVRMIRFTGDYLIKRVERVTTE